MIKELEQLKSVLIEKDCSCVVLKSDQTFTSDLKGIKPIIQWLNEEPDFFKNAFVADKIIGKAAALLLLYGGVKAIYASVISDSASELLSAHNIPFEFDKKVPFIQNRENTDICPMEKKVLEISSPKLAFEVFTEFFKTK